ncbi:hypothetical protein FFWV33_02225 [Flavobacterium faecale]|uniref:Outer membrane protein beta-barrel domain-containing protein n=1 Tax=Flavobacterium faecale TaxID=1355330 RepID=A0A2S1L9T2_9FLAO|nr:porin family protein [Flavobacterium faecale]AWG20428.1 hypothetical protein FFWV33_02225 [Flavobacterium faecale]
MKKGIVIAIIALSGLVGNAQSVKFGSKLGLNVNSIIRNTSINQFEDEVKVGYMAGTYMDISLSKRFHLQFELLYAKNKYDTTEESSINPASPTDLISNANVTLNPTDAIQQSVSENYKTAYINVPMLAKIYPVKWWSIDAGVQAGYLLDAKRLVQENVTITPTGGNVNPSVSLSSTPLDEVAIKEFDRIQFGALIGSTLYFTKNINLGLRYDLGITNLRSNSGTTEKNGIYSASLGYSF